MAQSLAQIYLHVVFSTKDRCPYLRNAELRANTHSYIAGICQNLKCMAMIVGGAEDHVHVLCRLGRETSASKLIQEIKRSSSINVKSKERGLESFHWQNGYGAFSVSPAHVPALRQYIANQQEHHRQETFQEEFRRLLNKYGLEYDEQYVWD